MRKPGCVVVLAMAPLASILVTVAAAHEPHAALRFGAVRNRPRYAYAACG